MKLSVVIVSYNTRDWLMPCLDSVLSETAAVDLEIIVVDNGSTDGSLVHIKQNYPMVHLVENQENVGFPAANNQGFAISKGEYILMLNPDTLVHSNALSELVRTADNMPHAAIWGARTLDSAGRFDLTGHPFPTLATTIYAFLQLNKFVPGILDDRYAQVCEQAQQPVRVDWVQGCCLLFRRELLNTIGDLDPQFFLYAEEVDFSYRASQAGLRTYYVPTAEITHYGSKSTSQNTPLKVSNHHLSKLRFFRKHRSRGAVWLLKAFFVFELGLKAVIRAGQLLIRRQSTAKAYLRAYRETLASVFKF